MEKRRSYRNRGYLQWVVTRKCLITGKPAEVAHHVRSKDDTSGMGLKPSDYRVIPLLHLYHTTGNDAVHRIGEESFCQKFRLNVDWEILCLLETYFWEVYGEKYIPEGARGLLKEEIVKLERLIEEKRPEEEKTRRSQGTPMGKKKKGKVLPLSSEQIVLKEKQRAYEKEMREKLKKKKTEELKEQKKDIVKSTKKKNVKRKPVESEWSVEMKKKLSEVRKEREKAYKESEEYLSFHEKRKEEMRRLRKESYQKSKEWRKGL